VCLMMFNCEKEVVVCLLFAGATTYERSDRELRFPSSVSFESSKRTERELRLSLSILGFLFFAFLSSPNSNTRGLLCSCFEWTESLWLVNCFWFCKFMKFEFSFCGFLCFCV